LYPGIFQINLISYSALIGKNQRIGMDLCF
jgi:hypothetical protein